MPLVQLDTENADRDLTSLITVLTDTPHASKATLCQGLVLLGDGAKNLDGTGGDFSLTITVGGQTIQPDPQEVTFSTAVRSSVWTTQFPVPANTEVILRVLSPNGADTDVDVTAYLYEVTGALPDAAPDAAGGLPISDAGGLDIDTLLGTLTSLSSETRDANVLDQFKRTLAIIESQRGAHSHQPIGDIFFVDPANGNTHGNGNRGGITDPYLTIQDCHDNAVTDSNHDLIILLAGNAADVTTHTVAATTTISKRYTFIRGPGRDFVITRSGNGDTLEVTADGVELSGFQLETAATGSGNGIQITDADFLRVHNLWVNATRGDGINILRGENCQIHNNVFTNTGQSGAGQGIDILGTAGSSSNNVIQDNIFRDCAGDAIQISGGTTNNTTIQHNTIEGSTSWGIDIGNSSTDAFVSGNCLGNNSSGDINDNGTTSVVKNNVEWAKHSIWTEARAGALTDWIDGGRLDLILDATLAMLDDARAEPGQGAPPVNPDAMTKLDYLYKAWRNKKEQTASEFTLYADDGTTADQQSSVTDDGTTATVGEMGTGA